MNTPIAPAANLQSPSRPDTRVKSKHWTTREFRATFAEFQSRWDRKLNRRVRTARLTDVYDGTNTLITLHWTVDCPKSLAALCTHEGCALHFEAEYSATCFESVRAGVPLLRAPFRKVGGA